MKRRAAKWSALFSVLGLLALAGATAAGGADTTESYTVPATFSYLSDCTGEFVTGEGMMHVTEHHSEDGAHDHVTIHSWDSDAIGMPSGQRYVGSVLESESSNSHGDGSTFTLVTTVVLNRVGEDRVPRADDMVVHTIIHFTVNANGEMTVDRVEMHDECR